MMNFNTSNDGGDNVESSPSIEDVLSKLYNVNETVTPENTKFIRPLASTESLLNRARQFLPQIQAANEKLDTNTTSFVEVIDKNEDKEAENVKPRKKPTQPIIEMIPRQKLIFLIVKNLALGVFEEKEKKPNIITSLDDENDELSDEEASELKLPNNTRDYLNKQEDVGNQAAVMNLMGALFNDSDDEEDEEESDTSSSEPDEVE